MLLTSPLPSAGDFWCISLLVLDSLKKTLICGRQDLCLKFLLKNKNLFPTFETVMKETIVIQVKARACSLMGNKKKGRQLTSSTHHLFLLEPQAVQQYFPSIANSSNCKSIIKITILQILIKIAT